MSKELAAFALVAEEYERTGDPVRGLKPLFAPLLVESKEKPFDADKFSVDFTEAYGLQMSSFVASALAERMVELELLSRNHDRNTGTSYTVSSFEWESEPIAEAQVAGTIGFFVEWARGKAGDFGREFDEVSLEDAMLTRLARPEFASIFVQSDGEKNNRLRKMMGVAAVDRSAKDEAFLDYLVASFVLHVEGNAPAIFDSISLVSYGSLIADAVAGLAAPVRASSGEKQLRLVFDAPLLLDLLDLNSPAHRRYATGLIEIANGAGMMLAVFDHSLEEMRQTIQATLEACARGEGYGPMAQRLRTEKGKGLSAALVRDHLRIRVEELGFTVLRAERYREARYLKWFPDDRVDQVRNAIGDLHEHLEARIRDAESVAAVARLKAERSDAENLFDAGSIFITRNSVLSKRVNRALSRGRSKPSPTFCIATDGQIAGVLWFVSGMQGVELSRRRLIANCSAAILPRRELISRIASMLEGISQELRQEFEALMADSRASLCVMRLTAGDLDLIDRDKSIQVIEEMRAQLTAPALQRAEAAEAAEARALELKRAADVRVSMAEEAAESARASGIRMASERDNEVRTASVESAQLRLDLDAQRRRNEELEEQLTKDKLSVQGRIEWLLSQNLDKRTRFVGRIKGIMVLLASILIMAAALPDASTFVRICATFVSILTFGAFLKHATGFLERFAAWYFRQDLIAIGELEQSIGADRSDRRHRNSVAEGVSAGL